MVLPGVELSATWMPERRQGLYFEVHRVITIGNCSPGMAHCISAFRMDLGLYDPSWTTRLIVTF